jgi:hypothetical protein
VRCASKISSLYCLKASMLGYFRWMPLKDLDGKVVNTIWAAKKLLIRNRIFIR